MKINLASHAGFCMGVRQAVLRIVHVMDSSNEELYVYGPLIHNPQTVEALEARGMRTINDLTAIEGKRIVVRTHGIPRHEMHTIKERASGIVNLTCPRVARVQSLIKKYASQGYHTVIIGDRDHAEVIGLKSFASSGVTIIDSPQALSAIPEATPILVVSQTTFDRNLFTQIASCISRSRSDAIVFDTICDATRNRQEGVIAGIKDGIDTLVVVGGKNSANTKRLAEIGRESGVHTLHVETEEELSDENFRESKNVLVTAGTSTPGWIINNVLERLYTIRQRKRAAPLRTAMTMLQTAVRSNILAAGCAFFLSIIFLSVSGGVPDIWIAVIPPLYIFAMHTVNNYVDRFNLRLTNPYKFSMYQRHGHILIATAITSCAAAGILALRHGITPAILVGVSCLLGFIYNAGPIQRIASSLPSRTLRRLYRSKLVAVFGWVVIVAVLPLFIISWKPLETAFITFLVFVFVFLRSILLDMIAFQGDLITGRDTLPVWFGHRLLTIVSAGLALTAVAATIIFAIMKNELLLALLTLPIGYQLALLMVVSRLSYLIALKYELLVDMAIIVLAACCVALC